MRGNEGRDGKVAQPNSTPLQYQAAPSSAAAGFGVGGFILCAKITTHTANT